MLKIYNAATPPHSSHTASSEATLVLHSVQSQAASLQVIEGCDSHVGQ
ncbi:hypothetical protein KBC54_04235 [Patescibacteria group bacterium]|nr:hypothetical protein [Patescibacteria group bacterium]